MMLHDVVKSVFDRAQIDERFTVIINQVGLDRFRGQVVNQRNDQKYTPLHVSIFQRNIHAFEALLDQEADGDIRCYGTPLFHLLVRAGGQPNGLPFAAAAFDRLLRSPANPYLRDDNGYNVLHLMAMYDFVNLVVQLAGVAELSSLLSMAGRYDGFTPLHLAARYNSTGMTQWLLSKRVSSASIPLSRIYRRTPLHEAAIAKSVASFAILWHGWPDIRTLEDGLGRTAEQIWALDGWTCPDLSSGEFISSNDGIQNKVALLSSPLCRRHHSCHPYQLHTSQVPPENVHRLHVLLDERDGALLASCLRPTDRLVIDLTCRPAPIADVLKVHDWAYVRRVQAACEGLDPNADHDGGLAQLDGDTTLSRESYNAALAAAGTACRAVDLVIDGTVKAAFCAIRPPGHHAGPRGAVASQTGSESHGFCLFNNASVAAAYAMSVYRRKVKRVAIVDFDVHHGNGTEATVRALKPRTERVASIAADYGLFGDIHAPFFKPWRDMDDPDNVLFVSVHGYGPPQRGLEHLFPSRAAFYPGTGRTTLPVVLSPVDGDDGVQNEVSGTQESAVEHDEVVEENEDDVEMMIVAASELDYQDVDENDDENEDEESDEDFQPGGLMQVEEEEASNTSESELVKPIQASGGVAEFRRIFNERVIATSQQPSRAPSPMIVDIGLSLPAAEEGRGGGSEAAAARSLADFEYRHQWRTQWRQQIFPRLITFQPSLLLISAGFDGHRKDGINAGYLALGEEDFAWLTSQLQRLVVDGRIVSLLEGGYMIGGEFSSAFARSAAAHLEELTTGASGIRPFSVEESDAEQVLEEKHLDELRQTLATESERRRREEERLYQEQLLLRQQMMAAKQEQQPSEAATFAPEFNTASDEGGSTRKRRRPAVDYAELDAKLNQESFATS